MDCPSTRWQLKSRRQRYFKKTKARLRPSKPVSSTLDRFIPHRHIDISEFQLNSSIKKKTEQDKRQQQPSSSSMSQSYDTMGESFTTSSSDESLMSVSTSSSLSTSLSEDALDDTTCYGDPFSEEVAAILFEGHDKKSGDVLNFRSRKHTAKRRDSMFSTSRHCQGCGNTGTMTSRRHAYNHRRMYLDNLQPERIIGMGQRYDIADVQSDGDVLFINDDDVHVWNPISNVSCELIFKKSDYVAKISCAGWHDNAKMFATATTLAQNRAFITLTNLESRIWREYYDEFELESSPLCIQWNRIGITCGCEDGGVYHYDDRCRSNRPVLMFDGHCMPVVSCRYNKARDLLATGDLQGDLMIWDMRQPKIPANSFKEAHKGRISGMSWCPWQPDLLATGNARHQPTLKFWNLLTGLKSRERRVSHEVTSVQWLESEQELISSHKGTPEAIVFWNYPSLERCGTLTNDDDETNSTGLVRVKKSYQMIATSEESDSIYVWDLEQTRESMTSHRGQPSTVLSRRRSLIQLGLMR